MAISDRDLVRHLKTVLFKPGFKVTTPEDIVKTLESQLGVHLSHKTSFIAEQAAIALALVYPIYPADHFNLNPLSRSHEGGTSGSKPKSSSLTGNGEPGPEKWIMSRALAGVYGTGEREALKEEVVERIREYAILNKLEDPENKNVILCDAKLQRIFGCESVFTSDVPGMIDIHLFKRF